MGQLREPLHQVLDSPEEPRGLTLEAVNRCGRTIDCHLTLSSLRADRAGGHGGVMLQMEEQPVEKNE